MSLSGSNPRTSAAPVPPYFRNNSSPVDSGPSLSSSTGKMGAGLQPVRGIGSIGELTVTAVFDKYPTNHNSGQEIIWNILPHVSSCQRSKSSCISCKCRRSIHVLSVLSRKSPSFIDELFPVRGQLFINKKLNPFSALFIPI